MACAAASANPSTIHDGTRPAPASSIATRAAILASSTSRSTIVASPSGSACAQRVRRLVSGAARIAIQPSGRGTSIDGSSAGQSTRCRARSTRATSESPGSMIASPPAGNDGSGGPPSRARVAARNRSARTPRAATSSSEPAAIASVMAVGTISSWSPSTSASTNRRSRARSSSISPAVLPARRAGMAEPVAAGETRCGRVLRIEYAASTSRANRRRSRACSTSLRAAASQTSNSEPATRRRRSLPRSAMSAAPERSRAAISRLHSDADSSASARRISRPTRRRSAGSMSSQRTGDSGPCIASRSNPDHGP